MRNPITYFLAAITLFTASNNLLSQPVRGYYPDGKVKSELRVPTTPGKPSTFLMYHPNHMMLTEGECLDGIVVGEKRMAWYDNGNRMYEFDLKDGIAVGKLFMYYENGARKLEGEFADGRPAGFWKLWNEKGVLMISGEMLSDGRFKIIEARDVFREKVIGQGEGTLSYFRTEEWDGKEVTVKVEGKYVDGFKEGRWTVGTLEGKLIEEANYSRGYFEGKYLRYNPNGTMAVQRAYSQGRATGKWTLSNNAGKVIKIEEFGEIKSDTSNVGQYRVEEEDVIWRFPFKKVVPLTTQTEKELNILTESLFTAGRKGEIWAFKDQGMNVLINNNSFQASGLTDTLYALPVAGRMSDQITHYSNEDISAYVLYGSAFSDKQFCTYATAIEVMGIQFGKGDTAVTPIWIPWFYIRHLSSDQGEDVVEKIYENVIPSLMEPLDSDEFPSNLAEYLNLSEQTWVTTNTQWLFLYQEQLNLRGVNRKGL